MRRLVAPVLLAALVLGACSSKEVWRYRPEFDWDRAPLVRETLVVEEFTDARPGERSNWMALGLVPLVPYGWQDFAKPEREVNHTASRTWRFRPLEDLPQAIAAELDASHVFERVLYDADEPAAYRLRGKLVSMDYSGCAYSYGLSIAGQVLWLFGLPMSSTSNRLTVRLELFRDGGDEPVWTHLIDEESSTTQTLYGWQTDFDHPEMLRRAMGPLRVSLEAALTD